MFWKICDLTFWKFGIWKFENLNIGILEIWKLDKLKLGNLKIKIWNWTIWQLKIWKLKIWKFQVRESHHPSTFRLRPLHPTTFLEDTMNSNTVGAYIFAKRKSRSPRYSDGKSEKPRSLESSEIFQPGGKSESPRYSDGKSESPRYSNLDFPASRTKA